MLLPFKMYNLYEQAVKALVILAIPTYSTVITVVFHFEGQKPKMCYTLREIETQTEASGCQVFLSGLVLVNVLAFVLSRVWLRSSQVTESNHIISSKAGFIFEQRTCKSLIICGNPN